MRRPSLHWLWVTAALLGSAATAAALPPPARRALREAEQALTELRVEDAQAAIEPLLLRHAADAEVLRVAALVRFHSGAYEEAVAWMEASLRARPPRGEGDRRLGMLNLLRSTRETTRGFVEARSEDGRFVIFHAPGRDRHLVDYALRAMRGADRALSEELGYRMPGPVRLEIFPDAASLASVSTLTLEAIERTGTIALCKWDKLMVTSPRALLRGYPWMDTIAHEYVHLVLSRASRDRAPVWLQEGVAKFLERRWREPRAQAHLSPAARGLLARAVRDDALIPFERIHPSIALLPSQEDAALAFAQVSTFVARYYETQGADALRAAIARIAEGEDAREALAAAAGTRWEELERAWRQSLPRSGDAPPLLRRHLRAGGDDESAQEVAEVSPEARRGLRLGDLLWARRRYRAAAVEYAAALAAAPGDPIVASRLARAAVEAGDPEQALQALTPVAERYPEHAPTQALLARAHRLLGDTAEARRAAERAIELNPFDPSPHCDLAQVGVSDQIRRREADRCRDLGGEVP